MAPSVNCEGPVGTLGSGAVTATWAYVPDAVTQAVQAEALVRVFAVADALDPAFDPETTEPVVEVSVAGTAASLAVPTYLDNGEYLSYVRVTDSTGATSAWCSSAFTVAVDMSIATRPTKPVEGRLGCGSYTLMIQPRGGVGPQVAVPFKSLDFGRRIDDVSDLRAAVGAAGLASDVCCDALSTLRAWEHEIAVWRDDGSDEATWVGPAGDPDFGTADANLTARDLFQWMERRDLPFDRSFRATDLGIVFAQYVDDALAADMSPNIDVAFFAAGVKGDRAVLASAHRRAADELRELARSGVDFTMVSRRLLVAGQELPLVPLPTLTDEMVDKPRLKPRGLEAASKVNVIGASRPNTNPAVPFFGSAGGFDPGIGLVETTVTEDSIKDDVSCRAAAATRLDMLKGVPQYVEAVLRPNTPVRMVDLIPGARWPVALTFACRTLETTMRLQSVSVSVSIGDSGQTEQVTVTLEPLGTVDGI